MKIIRPCFLLCCCWPLFFTAPLFAMTSVGDWEKGCSDAKKDDKVYDACMTVKEFLIAWHRMKPDEYEGAKTKNFNDLDGKIKANDSLLGALDDLGKAGTLPKKTKKNADAAEKDAKKAKQELSKFLSDLVRQANEEIKTYKEGKTKFETVMASLEKHLAKYGGVIAQAYSDRFFKLTDPKDLVQLRKEVDSAMQRLLTGRDLLKKTIDNFRKETMPLRGDGLRKKVYDKLKEQHYAAFLDSGDYLAQAEENVKALDLEIQESEALVKTMMKQDPTAGGAAFLGILDDINASLADQLKSFTSTVSSKPVNLDSSTMSVRIQSGGNDIVNKDGVIAEKDLKGVVTQMENEIKIYRNKERGFATVVTKVKKRTAKELEVIPPEVSASTEGKTKLGEIQEKLAQFDAVLQKWSSDTQQIEDHHAPMIKEIRNR